MIKRINHLLPVRHGSIVGYFKALWLKPAYRSTFSSIDPIQYDYLKFNIIKRLGFIGYPGVRLYYTKGLYACFYIHVVLNFFRQYPYRLIKRLLFANEFAFNKMLAYWQYFVSSSGKSTIKIIYGQVPKNDPYVFRKRDVFKSGTVTDIYCNWLVYLYDFLKEITIKVKVIACVGRSIYQYRRIHKSNI